MRKLKLGYWGATYRSPETKKEKERGQLSVLLNPAVPDAAAICNKKNPRPKSSSGDILEPDPKTSKEIAKGLM